MLGIVGIIGLSLLVVEVRIICDCAMCLDACVGCVRNLLYSQKLLDIIELSLCVANDKDNL